MLTLATPVPVPNIQKIHIDSVQLDGNALVATVVCGVQGGGGLVYASVTLKVSDGTSQGIRATVSPLGYFDRVEVFAVTTPTGFTDLVTAYTGNILARNRAAETALQSAGLLPAGGVS